MNGLADGFGVCVSLRHSLIEQRWSECCQATRNL
jgi:hypothetical protein